MAVFFVLEGIAVIFIALQFRRYLHNRGWTSIGGLINLVLAYLIWSGWPNTASWVVGLYVGINLFFFGLAMIMTAFAARNIGTASTAG
jgi:uncharacterized membrane protein HdeD (DUF308 family)